MADSLSIFGEGTFEEQIQELVKYLARPESEEGRSKLIQPFQEALASSENQVPVADIEPRRKEIVKLLVSEIKGLGDGNEREIEGFFNLVYCHVLSSYPPDSPESTNLVTSLIQAITSTPPTEQTSVKYRLLSHLFNALPNRSTLRPQVYKALLNLATVNEELEVLQLKVSDLERWLDEWDISVDERSEFIKSISDAYAKVGRTEESYSFEVFYVRSIPANSPKAQAAALAVIAKALKLPTVFSFDALLKLNTVRAARDHQLFSLLKILIQGSLTDYQQWVIPNDNILGEFATDLDKRQLERKLKLLILGDLGAKNIGRDVPYHEISSALQIGQDEVEVWVIDVIRSKLLSGRLSQPQQTLHVTRSISRSFDKEEWETIENRLITWKTGLQGILAVITAAKNNVAATTATALSQSSQPQTTRPIQVVQA
ncbi:hypothetical protein Clacol_001435 [Clathrus columnatus]|uniref:Eukaryotic translation initiation factor 3 subunit M n=1 Tax=Clathrus columnatus TaxID=1419009 RepID=A0AAV5A2L1_9AGAM|nr:hypothetical protein Clacol_001435 [Clathrus columnatus]